MRTYLVTGAAGFIGSGVAGRLLDRGDAVVGIDNLNDFYSRALKEERLQELLVRPSFQFHKVDIECFPDVVALFERYRFQAVYNLAARAGVRYSLENPWVYMRTNADGTLNLLEAMRRNSGRLAPAAWPLSFLRRLGDTRRIAGTSRITANGSATSISGIGIHRSAY